jgi:hypothetical protein
MKGIKIKNFTIPVEINGNVHHSAIEGYLFGIDGMQFVVHKSVIVQDNYTISQEKSLWTISEYTTGKSLGGMYNRQKNKTELINKWLEDAQKMFEGGKKKIERLRELVKECNVVNNLEEA